MGQRIGFGFDVHEFEKGRDLILGNLKIPFEKGLKGHSDADALLHAITDALLGALALGDIGTHFPDTDAAYKGIDSLVLLKRAYTLVQGKGYYLVNMDATIMAQEPKISPHIPQMRKNLSQGLGVPQSTISIKATTTEHLGFIGRKEGIAAQAVVLLSNENSHS